MTSTIRDLILYELGGTVYLVFAPEGVQFVLSSRVIGLATMASLFHDASQRRTSELDKAEF